ncbi:MAG TPA: YebC/PmpR family DNA-binding transcriptional regulator, partial [Deinococcales bacterium]|nr:YebC/PmpR family DNA-binding transcriptional regulator [Deinococcales bacterium]
RAIGSTEGDDYDEVVYEGYGPAGVAIMVEALTDNRNRTAAEVRHVFTKHGGNMSGSTAWQFDSRGVIVIPETTEELQELAIELGALDLEVDEDGLTVYTEPTELYSVLESLQEQGTEPSVSQLTKLPQTPVELDRDDSEKIIRLLEAFEELDDVQNVYSTASFSEDIAV